MNHRITKYIILLIAVWLPCITHAQKVGLVLSGGGAKGLTHIGIIRALEENNIPIDYIAGTSIGAIVGSLYAMGYSPDDMEKLLKSDDFKRWYSGTIEEKYMYYFKKNPPTPEFISIPISLRDPLRKVKPQFLPTSIVNPVQMNIVFMEYFGQATAAAHGDFDQLFVPFRCVASDIYNKRPLVFSHGDLGDAVRASMSFPGMFKPIKVDSLLVYDGGIYNNFPVNVMRETFHPDIMIGSIVSNMSSKPEEGDLISQFESMIMQKTDYSLPDSLGILMKFDLKDVGLMDFDRYDELHDLGYHKTIEMIDSIKHRISRRLPQRQLELRRMEFKNKWPQIRFRNIYIQGANYAQQRYIRREFHENHDGYFSMEDMRRAYFRLMSDNMISEIIPHMVYNSFDNSYDLHLKVKIEDDLSVRIGGNVGSNGSNAIYAGLTYHNLNNYSKEFSLDAQLGEIYSNIQVSGRLDIPTRIPSSFRLLFSHSNFSYQNQGKFFSMGSTNSFNLKKETFMKFYMSLPFLSSRKAEFSFGGAILNDYYFRSDIIDFNKDEQDHSKYLIWGGGLAFEGNILNRKQFATKGWQERLSAQAFSGRENFVAGIADEQNMQKYDYVQSWLQLSYELEKYFNLHGGFTMGTYLKAFYSSRNFSQNYRATLMQAGEFSPTPHSRIVYNEAFRGNHFVGLGLIPIYEIGSMFGIRLGGYGFFPLFPIIQNSQGMPEYGKLFHGIQGMGELNLVFKLPFGSVSGYVNYYSSPKANWNIGLTLGWQLFGNQFLQ